MLENVDAVLHSDNRAAMAGSTMRWLGVHPTLAKLLAEWKEQGCAETLGRTREPDDLVPSREGKMRSRLGYPQYVQQKIKAGERSYVLGGPTSSRGERYRCRCRASPKLAPGPLRLPGGGRHALDFAVEVAISKWLDHAPLERQVRVMRREGLDIDSSTRWEPAGRLARVLGPTADAVRRYVVESPVVQTGC